MADELSGGRLIITNQSTIDDITALEYVYTVMKGGRISDKSYCYVTIFDSAKNGKCTGVY